ncbi:MAG: M55 family metallopeptidase [Verrucomicrobia bacterium]|nr:M55 family metallopeptidase [Verrucomicrobiota bacterium]
MIIWICTDMEGLAGVDHWDQCYDPDDNSPKYLHGREQLTADANAAIAGCFDAGATEVRILDGHGRNANKGFTSQLDPRAKPWRVKPPIEITVEWAWTGRADPFARTPGVKRPHPRVTCWSINDPRDVYNWPGTEWKPAV